MKNIRYYESVFGLTGSNDSEEREVALSKKNNRGANGTGTIRQRSDGYWEGRYCAGVNPETGKIIRKSVYGKTQKEVRIALTQKLFEIDDGFYMGVNTEITLEEWLEIWMKEYSINKKYSTLKGYKAQIKKHINPALGHYTLQSITPIMIQRFLNDLSRPDESGKALAPKSVKNVHMILKAALSQAVENEYIKKNPCRNAKLPRIIKTQVKPLSDEQVSAFLKASFEDVIYGSMLRLILFTGLREGEAMGLTWDCVDFEKGALIINKQLQRRPQKDGGTVLSSVKNGKTRQLKPAPYVMQLLKSRYSQQIMQSRVAGSAWEAWQNEGEHKKALVFTNEVGHHLIPKRTYLRFKKIAEEIGVPDARVHDLRHTFAVLSLQNGDDVKTVQTNLGHASAAFTLDVYGHVNDRMQRESSDRMEQYIKSLAANG